MTTRLFAAVMAIAMCGLANAATINVPGDYPTIQMAINASFDGDVILVAPGTYNENLYFNSRGITLRSSGGPSVTSIVGQSTESEYVVNVESLAGPGAIEGFDIGSTKAIGRTVLCDDSTLSVINCRILEELRGLFAKGGSILEIRDSHLSSTDGECIYLQDSSVLTLSDSSLTSAGDNVLYAPSGSQITISGCSFENSTCVRLLQLNGGPLVLLDSVFRGNTTGNNMLHIYCSASISGCTFESNVTNAGYICRVIDSETGSTMSDCTFAGNSAAVAAVGTGDEGIQISGTTFCENTPVDIVGPWVNGGGNEFLVECNDVEGACCLEDACYEVELLFCEAAGGEWLGYNATCTEDSCLDPPLFGACCINGEAISLYDYDCLRIQGLFMGEGVDPADVVCPEACQGDVNGDGVVGVDDILIVIGNWGPCP